MTGHVLVARLDNFGDVLLAGPTVRAVAGSADRVTFLAGPSGRAAAAMLPGVDEVLTFAAPWILDPANPVSGPAVEELLSTLAARAFDAAVVLTSFHQSALPLALLLRLAGVTRIAATSVDYPGSLLDHRLPYVSSLHEVEQHLSVARSMGFSLPADDDGCLAVRSAPLSAEVAAVLPASYVVVHQRASVPARSMSDPLATGTVEALRSAGRSVVLTGTRPEAATWGPDGVVDLSGRTDLSDLAGVLRRADVVVTGNTGPAHLAAAVGTPVVSIFAPVVDPRRWLPWMVPHRVLGWLDIECAGCRSRTCPLEGQPCTAVVRPVDVVAAVEDLASVGLVAEAHR